MRIVIVNVSAVGHVNPTLPLCCALSSAGHVIEYYVPNTAMHLQARIEATGALFKTHPVDVVPILHELAPDSPLWQDQKQHHQLKHSLVQTACLGDWFSKNVHLTKKDILVYDFFATWAAVLCAVYPATKAICSMSWGVVPDKDMTPPSNHSELDNNTWKGWAEAYLNTLFTQDKKNKHDLDDDLDDAVYLTTHYVLSRTMNLVWNRPCFHPDLKDMELTVNAKSFKFVGCAIAEPLLPLSVAHDAILTQIHSQLASSDSTDPVRKVLYISLGTVQVSSVQFWKLCWKAFQDPSFLVICALSGAQNASSIFKALPHNTWPNHFIAAESVPQLHVLRLLQEHKQTAFISHCGLNSVMEALSCKIPLLCLPHCSDQPFLAYQVEDARVGCVLDMVGLSYKQLHETAIMVCESVEMRTRLDTLYDDLKCDPKTVAELLTSVHPH